MWWPWKSEDSRAKVEQTRQEIEEVVAQVAREGEPDVDTKMEIEETVAQGLLDKTETLEAVIEKTEALEDRLKAWEARLAKQEKDLQRREMELAAGQAGLSKGLADLASALAAAKADCEKRQAAAVQAGDGIQVVAPDGSTTNLVEHHGTVLSDNDAVVAIPASGINGSMVAEAVQTIAGVAATFLHCFGGNCAPTKVASKEEGHEPHHAGSHMSFFD